MLKNMQHFCLLRTQEHFVQTKGLSSPVLSFDCNQQVMQDKDTGGPRGKNAIFYHRNCGQL